VSHELRTPLARIRVALEMATDQGDQQRRTRYLQEIGTDLAELEQLIENVLTAAKLDLANGRGTEAELPLKKGRISIVDVMERASERFRTIHVGRELRVTSDPLPDAIGDATFFRRAIDNLLDNAAKYSEAPAPITLDAKVEAGTIVFRIGDRGIGIEPADMGNIFTPFFRTDRSRARGTGGVGLGLTLARSIIVAHGGEMSVESKPGEGTTVRFTLPAAGETA
jgi:two-component system, OmpR family, sensor kinase